MTHQPQADFDLDLEPEIDRIYDEFGALLTEREAADLLGTQVRTLQTWRQAGTGPPYVKLGEAHNAPVRLSGGQAPAVPAAAHGPHRRRRRDAQRDGRGDGGRIRSRRPASRPPALRFVGWRRGADGAGSARGADRAPHGQAARPGARSERAHRVVDPVGHLPRGDQRPQGAGCRRPPTRLSQGLHRPREVRAVAARKGRSYLAPEARKRSFMRLTTEAVWASVRCE